MSQLCTIIGLSGRAQSGKSTCGDIIQEMYPDFVQFAIADPLKYEVAQAFKLDDEFFHSPKLKETPLYQLAIHRCEDKDFIELCRSLNMDLYIPQSPRKIMQLWGAEYRRAQNQNYWLDIALEYIRRLIEIGVQGIVVTDVRFPNEAEAIKSCGGQLVMIHRSDNYNPAPPHESENTAALDQWVDHLLHNKGSMEAFILEVSQLMTHITHKSNTN